MRIVRRISTTASCLSTLRELCVLPSVPSVLDLSSSPKQKKQTIPKTKTPTRGFPFLTKNVESSRSLRIRRTLRRIIRRRINPRRHLIPAAPHRHHLRLFLLRLFLLAISCVLVSHPRRLSHLTHDCQQFPACLS